MKKTNRIIGTISCLALCVFLFAACGKNGDDPYRDGKIHVAALNGNTMMGLGWLYNRENNNPDSLYTFTKEGTPDAIVAGLANGTFDAAFLPANTAAVVFNSGSIDMKVAAIVGQNLLYMIQKAGTPPLTRISDLSGKTVYLPVQGSTNDVAFRYLMARNNISDIRIEFEAEGSTIAAGLKLADSRYDYAVLPQPAATVATFGPGAAVEAFNLYDEWKKFNPQSGIVTSVLLVRSAYLKNNKASFEKFLEDYKQSIDFMAAVNNLDTAAQYVVDMAVIPALPLARAALPKCGLTFIDKAEMKKNLSDFFQALYDQNPQSVGGKLPSNNFYYE